MNSSQIHLALTHAPVFLSIMGVVFLIVALMSKNVSLTKTSFYLLLFAGVAAIPVFFTGEGAEETVEHLPGVSKSVIERHEELAKFAFGAVSITAIISLLGLLLYKRENVLRLLKPLVLILGVATAGIMTATAHLGGQVRHTEIRSGFTTQNEKGVNNDLQNKGNDDKD